MIRLTEIKLPLDHTEADLQDAILKKLGITAAELVKYTIFKRSYDARKRGAIAFVYAVDITTSKQDKLLKRFQKDPHIFPTPDTTYNYIATAPDKFLNGLKNRPIVIGTGASQSCKNIKQRIVY